MKSIYTAIKTFFLTSLVTCCFNQIATGQTPVAVLENATGDTVLTSFEDGGLLVPGQLNTGTIPAEGSGVRMMWYPAKGAFRAGGVLGTRWNNDHIGLYSIAFGQNTSASGKFSTACGYLNIASGDYSAVWGYNTKATTISATAFGESSLASGNHSTAFGQYSQASGALSTSFGLLTQAIGGASTAFGQNTIASGENSTAFGNESVASGINSTAFGFYTKASGDYSTAIGEGTVATNSNSLSIGKFNMPIISNQPVLFVIGNGLDDANRSNAFRVHSNGTVFAAGSVLAPSDRRLKENIRTLEPHTLDKLAKIQPIRYRYKNQQTKPAGDQIGMIAQEVQAQFPELVSEGSNGFLSLSYSNFTAVLLKGMQEQQAQILEHEAQIQAQENQIREQQKELNKKSGQIKELQAQIHRLDKLEKRLAILEKRDHHKSVVDAE